MLNIWTEDMMWKYMTVLAKLVKSQRAATHNIMDPTTAKNCRKTDHLDR